MRVEAFFYTLSKQRIFPEAMLRICPGYRPADNGEPVAPPVRRQPPPGSRAQSRWNSRRRCWAPLPATDAKKPARWAGFLNLVG